MPTGVGSHFLQVLASEQRFATRRLAVGAAAAVLLAIPAYLLFPWEGLAVHLAGAALGAAAGWLAARWATKAYEASVRQQWQEWMRFAVGCESLREIHLRARGESLRTRAYLHAAALVLLWALEVTLLLVAFAGDEPGWLATPVVLANAAVMAGLATYYLAQGNWVGRFRASVSELVESGEIGVWGVM